MFLGAGSVMHGMNDQVDIRRFGGLCKDMPMTFGTFMLGYLAIIGIPPFSGFFSKDKIIEAAFDRGGWPGWLLGIVALLGAGLTAFYMTRLMVMTFFGQKRWTEDVAPARVAAVDDRPDDAAGRRLGGRRLPARPRRSAANWLAPVARASAEAARTSIAPLTLELRHRRCVVAARAWRWPALFSAAARCRSTAAGRRHAGHRAARAQPLHRRLQRGRCSCAPASTSPGRWSSSTTAGIDGAVNGLAAALGGGSGRLRRLQTGFVRSYALSMLGGALLVVGGAAGGEAG